MKFTIIIVMLAMAFAAEASVIWSPHHSDWNAGWGNGLWNHHNSWDGAWDNSWDDAWNHHGNHHGAWDGAWDDGHHHGSWDDGHHHGTHWAPHGTHGIVLAQEPTWDHHHHVPAHHAPAHHAHHDHHHDGHYVAKTLGAVHTAPLPGHIASVKSLNVAPAPGTH